MCCLWLLAWWRVGGGAGIGAEADLTGNSNLQTAVSDFNSVLKALGEYHGSASPPASGGADKDDKRGKKAARKLAESRVTYELHWS